MRQEALTKIYERDAIYDLVAMESDAEIESENDEETTSSEQNQTLDQTVRLRIDTTNVLTLVSRSFEDRIGDKVMVFDLYPKKVTNVIVLDKRLKENHLFGKQRVANDL
ncbi:hypothetical protein POTOM_033334 [Populus tomentosa]|uniref:Uncharacterized protein n=1 Tax=Populus tomentosa TaxID=118781 RepID=A0A8X7Z5M4_POPTO|nr:hypothetical protein POTOM_033334 [Populus tomentosa]